MTRHPGRKGYDWPKDTLDIIIKMRTNGYTWSEIATHFGSSANYMQNKYRELSAQVALQRTGSVPDGVLFFTEEEDAEIRRAYLALESMWDTAARLGRTRGSIYQRMLRHHSDLLGRLLRPSEVMTAVGRHGRGFLKIKEDPKEALAEFKKNRGMAKQRAKEAIEAAKQKRRREKFELMQDEIALGKPRNDAIFSARADGLDLKTIGDHFGMTRERVRQIFEKVASDRALAESIKEAADWNNKAVQDKVDNGSETIRDSDGEPIADDAGTADGHSEQDQITIASVINNPHGKTGI